MKPIANSIGVLSTMIPPHMVAIHEKIFTPVGIDIITVVVVKYARVSMSRPTVYMWCAHTIKPKTPIDIMA